MHNKATLNILTLLVILLVPMLGFGQASSPETPRQYASEKYFHEALAELEAMLDDDQPASFKQAVFLSENAYHEGRLNYQYFDSHIQLLRQQCRMLMKHRKLDYLEDDSLDVQKNAAIYSMLKDSLSFIVHGDTIVREPYTYDFEDFFGKRDWTKHFVSKLLNTQSGNCHSLPYLYRILAEELDAPAWLAMAPNHVYIKSRCQAYGMYNTELTTGHFPIDAWIMASGYIHLDAVRNAVYMDTLSLNESIASCVIDLAQGYRHKYGIGNGKFIAKACDLALKHYPNFANARLLQVETQRQFLFAGKGWHENPAAIDSNGEEFEEIEKQYKSLHKSGYRRMPDGMYLDWLASLPEQAQQWNDKDVLRIRPPPKYEPTNPFADLGYETKVLTLSKGKYIEEFDTDSILRIGDALYDWYNQQLVGFVSHDTLYSEYGLDPQINSRWLSPDPLAKEFPSWSPYVYTNDNPISLVDPDGMAPIPAVTGGGDKPTTKTWKAVNANRIRQLAYKAGLFKRVGKKPSLFNQAVGLAFEGTFSGSFDMNKNTTRYPTNSRKRHSSVIPDFVVSSTVLQFDWPPVTSTDASFNEVIDLDFYELKAGYRVGLSANDSQIKAMIDVLGAKTMPGMDQTVKEIGWGANLNLVMPVSTDLEWDLIDYADQNGVLISIIQPYENPNNLGEIMFTKPIMVTNKFSPILKNMFDTAGKAIEFLKGEYTDGLPLEGTATVIPFLNKEK